MSSPYIYVDQGNKQEANMCAWLIQFDTILVRETGSVYVTAVDGECGVRSDNQDTLQTLW